MSSPHLTASPPVAALVSSGKKSLPSSSVPPPDWRPHSRAGSKSSATGSGVCPANNKPESTVAGKGHVAFGRNGTPSTSTPRTPVAQAKTVDVSPTKSQSSLCGSSPVVCSSPGQKWRERDSGLSQSLLPAVEAGDGQAEELEKLLDDCRTTLGITASQDGPTNIAGKNHTSPQPKHVKKPLLIMNNFNLSFNRGFTTFLFREGQIHFLDILLCLLCMWCLLTFLYVCICQRY